MTEKSYAKVPYDIYACTGKSRITKPVKYVTGFAGTKIGDLSGIQGIKKSDSPNRIDTVLYSKDMFNRSRCIIHCIYVMSQDVKALLVEAENRGFKAKRIYEDDLKRLYNGLMSVPDDVKLYSSNRYQAISSYSSYGGYYRDEVLDGRILNRRDNLLGRLIDLADEYGGQLPYYKELDENGDPYMYIEGKDNVDMTKVNYMPRDEFIKKYASNDACDIDFVRWAAELEDNKANKNLVYMMLSQKDWTDPDSRMYCLAAAKLANLDFDQINTPQAKMISSMYRPSMYYGYPFGSYMMYHSTHMVSHKIPKDLYDEFVIPDIKKDLATQFEVILQRYYNDCDYEAKANPSIYGYYDDVKSLIKIG
jgi:hypothetical protein